MTNEQAHALGKCYANPAYFVNHFCQIYDAANGNWEPFHLWPAQKVTLTMIDQHPLSVILKARQLGMSWLVLAYALWQMIFRPAATVLVFSRRDTEALYLLSEDRLRGMYSRLPTWMKGGHGFVIDSGHECSMENGSSARAFPTSAGDSYTASLAIVDEADLVPDLNRLMRAVKPTIDNGGKMVLVSRADKSTPESEFKRIYRGAQMEENGWQAIFLPWHVHPARDAKWYAAQKVDIESRTGSLDDLHEQYPSSAPEALAPRSLDKRIPPLWLQAVYAEVPKSNALGLPGLSVYQEPSMFKRYRIGADPAEGNPGSDDSAAIVVDAALGEEVAVLSGKFQPSAFAAYIARLAEWYNEASVLVERNNHGHAVILWLQDNSDCTLLKGPDNKAGWPTTSKSKALMYADFTDKVRDHEISIHSFETYVQLASIEGGSLSAPPGLLDDRAVSMVLAVLSDQLLSAKKIAGTW